MGIIIRRGTLSDTDAFINLLENVRSGMENKEWFYLDPPEFVREQMDGGTMLLWVAMDGDRLAGALDVLIPGEESYNYGYDLDFDRETLMQVVNMDSAAVYPQYRGQGLQRKLLAEAEEALRQMGKWILLCTVHPDNHFSLENVRRQGYTVQKLLKKYGSVRYLLRKDIF